MEWALGTVHGTDLRNLRDSIQEKLKPSLGKLDKAIMIPKGVMGGGGSR